MGHDKGIHRRKGKPMRKSTLIGLCLSLSQVAFLAWPMPALAQHGPATYVPWGIDEYELFGLTRAEILQKYKGQLGFDKETGRVFFGDRNSTGYGRPQFELTYAHDRVVGVKRLFIDGAGCLIWGPGLNSKKDALNFSINGLMQTNRDAKDEARLKEARRQLAEEGPK